MPGEYVIRATVQTIRRGDAATPSERAEGFSPTYYLGTTSALEAQVTTLGTSEERTVQFSMVASRLSRVTRPDANARLIDGQRS